MLIFERTLIIYQLIIMSLKAKDLLDYQEKLINAANNGSSDIFFNDSILHAMVIMKEIFDKAAKEPRKTVCMYCGKFSLFRDKTKGKIFAEKMACLTNDLTEDERKQWEQKDFFTDLHNSLLSFIENDGSLKLIMEYDIETLEDNSVWEILHPSIQNKRTEIYTLVTNVGLDHFATTAEAYRVENSDSLKTATCCFGDKNNANVLNDNFKKLLGYSRQIEFI